MGFGGKEVQVLPDRGPEVLLGPPALLVFAAHRPVDSVDGELAVLDKRRLSLRDLFEAVCEQGFVLSDLLLHSGKRPVCSVASVEDVRASAGHALGLGAHVRVGHVLLGLHSHRPVLVRGTRTRVIAALIAHFIKRSPSTKRLARTSGRTLTAACL